jgi:hypothetical protein
MAMGKGSTRTEQAGQRRSEGSLRRSWNATLTFKFLVCTMYPGTGSQDRYTNSGSGGGGDVHERYFF